MAGLPSWIEIKRSILHPNAGRGAFTMKRIPKNTMIGEYTGKNITYEEATNIKENNIYFMGVRDDNGNLLHIIDAGVDEGSWIKYVNTALNIENSNVHSKTIDGRVYYITIRDIKEDEEILSWYGDTYVEYLRTL